MNEKAKKKTWNFGACFPELGSVCCYWPFLIISPAGVLNFRLYFNRFQPPGQTGSHHLSMSIFLITKARAALAAKIIEFELLLEEASKKSPRLFIIAATLWGHE